MDKSQQSMSWADEGEEAELPARSYDCTFCKRGFSNAQALGGHMNLHRKDRAKLKQPSIDYQEMISSTEVIGFLNQSSSNVTRVEMERSADHREKHSTSFSWFLPDQHDHEADHQILFNLGPGSQESSPRQLQLFHDSPSDHVVFSGNDHQRETKEAPGKHAKFGNETEREYSATDKEAVDLELRLGHEP